MNLCDLYPYYILCTIILGTDMPFWYTDDKNDAYSILQACAGWWWYILAQMMNSTNNEETTTIVAGPLPVLPRNLMASEASKEDTKLMADPPFGLV